MLRSAPFLSASLGSLLLASTAWAQARLPLANEELLRSARAWEARERGDLAILALEKLVATRPDLPEALLELGELYLRVADIAAAGRVRERLLARFKDSAAAHTFAIEYRFATRDRLQLASLQRLLQIKQGAKARIELDRLFPQGAPNGALGIEYYRLLAGMPGGYQRAAAGLRRLAQSHADDPRFRLALARFLLRREATIAEGVNMLQALARRDDVRRVEVDDALLVALKGFDVRVPAHVVRDYLTRHPGDALATDILVRQARLLEEKRLLASHALASIRPDLQRRLLEELEAGLAARGTAGATALTLAKGLRADARSDTRNDDAALAAATWVQRARRSIAAQRLELAAAQLEAVLALRNGQYEALIAIVARIETLDASQDGGELLALASRLAPASTWLFETQVRWLLDHQRTSQALAQLDARALDTKWTANARDSLRAAALEQRAQHALDADNVTQAIADLELAVRYAPQNPWSRYQLAGLYARSDAGERGRRLFEEGVHAAPSDEMRYAQSIYLSNIDAPQEAFAAIDAVAAERRSEGMRGQHARLRIELARAAALRHHRAGDTQAAVATLGESESLAATHLDLARGLAFGWIDIDEPQRALALIDAQQREHGMDRELLLAKAAVLNRLEDTTQLAALLEELRAGPVANHDQQVQLTRLQRSLDLRVIDQLRRNGKYVQAVARLDALLAAAPDDRVLRIARAELDLAMGQPRAARDRYAALVGEDPQDLDTRLAYVRALTEAGDAALARLQLGAIQEQVPAGDFDGQLDIARRQLSLDDAPGAIHTLESLLALQPDHPDVLLALGRAELSQRHFAKARDYFARAEHGSDTQVALQARLAGEQIDTRLQSRMESAFEIRHKPGDSGISRYDALIAPNAWHHALDFDRRIIAHADAVTVDSGRLGTDFDTAALFGTLQAAGPDAAQRTSNEAQSGIAFALSYETDQWSTELGTTPLGFLLPNLVGGIEWTPKLGPFDIALGLQRRAVTSSVLSYAGQRDPIGGEKWGGVVETGPYAQFGLYRERFSLSGSMRLTDLSGTHVASNQFVGLRSAADWQFFATADMRAYVGATVNYWSYQRNLQNYTFGSGGYYSPQSYLNIALPVELQGRWAGWSYQLRATLSSSTSKTERAAFYPNDPQLQNAALSMPLPAGLAAPFFAADSGGGVSFSAYAALERQVTAHLVLGAKLDLDRSDFYEPTVLMLYLRHELGAPRTQLAVPPRPARPFNE